MGIDKNAMDIRLDPSLDALRSNICDTVLNSVKTPIFDPLILQGPIIDEVKILMLSRYVSEDKKSKYSAGIMGSFSSFKLDSLVIIIYLLLIHVFLMNYSQNLFVKWVKLVFGCNKMRRQYSRLIDKKSIYNFIYCHFTHQSVSFPESKLKSMGILSVSIIVFAFIITFYYSALIKTEIVTVKIPSVIRTYQDIYSDPELELRFMVLDDSYRLFEDAFQFQKNKENDAEKSIETSVNSHDRSLVWKKVLRLQSNNKTDVLLKPNLESFKLIQELVSKPVVVIDYSHTYSILTNCLVPFLDDDNNLHSNVKMFMTSDPSEEPILRAIAFNSRMNPSHIKRIHYRASLFIQSGIYNNIGLQVRRPIQEFFKFNLGMVLDFSKYHLFISDKIILPHPVLITPDMKYYISLFSLIAVLFFVSFVIYSLEHRWHEHEIYVN